MNSMSCTLAPCSLAPALFSSTRITSTSRQCEFTLKDFKCGNDTVLFIRTTIMQYLPSKKKMNNEFSAMIMKKTMFDTNLLKGTTVFHHCFCNPFLFLFFWIRNWFYLHGHHFWNAKFRFWNILLKTATAAWQSSNQTEHTTNGGHNPRPGPKWSQKNALSTF